MADPIAYRVTVNRPFIFMDLVFGPAAVQGPKQGYPCYEFPADIYNNGTLADGTAIRDLCATVDPVYPPTP